MNMNALRKNYVGGSAVVVLSGGQDSVTCLLWALKVFDKVTTITFDYGQRHAVEIKVARSVCQSLGVSHKVVSLAHIGEVGISGLTGDLDVNTPHPLHPNLPASYVPNRNAMMLSAAHAWAQVTKAEHLVTGVCQTDYSGYPDCREDFIIALQEALNLGSDSKIEIHTPLMHLTKAETWALADELGGLDFVVENSHTCYMGDRSVRWDWGYGCGECPACKIRAAGYTTFMQGQA